MKIIIRIVTIIKRNIIFTRFRELIKEILIKKLSLAVTIISSSPAIRYDFWNTSAVRGEFDVPPKFSRNNCRIIGVTKICSLFFPNSFNKLFSSSFEFIIIIDVIRFFKFCSESLLFPTKVESIAVKPRGLNLTTYRYNWYMFMAKFK